MSASPPSAVRRVDSANAAALAGWTARFEELQTVLQCCEWLVSALAGDDEPDGVLVEAVWTTALLSYGRCFAADAAGAPLTEDDLTSALSNDQVLDWHRVLLRLRDHYADPSVNPREQFSVGVAQDDGGGAGGVAITSVRQPLVDDVTVRQTGAVAYALSRVVNDRIASQQEQVFGELRGAAKADLDKLPMMDVTPPDQGQDPPPSQP